MKLVADESVEGPTVSTLRAAGYEVLSIAEESPRWTQEEEGLLIAADKDFGESVFRNQQQHFGVHLIRSLYDDLVENAGHVLFAIEQHG